MIKTTKIGLVQINNSFSGQNYLPYSAACLQSFVKSHAKSPDAFEFLVPLFKRLPVSHAIDHLQSADVAGFSTYVWNARISLAIAEGLKAARPETVIVFGGPQVPDEPEEFLRQNPFIDVAVHNEGEQTFLSLLESGSASDWTEVPGISFIDDQGNFIKTGDVVRMRDLEQLPSPFLNRVFDDLMEACPDEKWIGLWETNRGCPFTCTFCDWGSATAAKLNKFELERLHGEADWFANNKIEFIFCCDANFGILPRDIELVKYIADLKKKTGYPMALSVQNTKNATERAYETERILAEAGLNKGVALSMQSLDPLTLENIKRENISIDTYLELQRRFTQEKVETYSDLILGLPGETYDSFAEGVEKLIASGQHNRIQFNNLSILPNAEMGNADYIRKHGIVTVESEIINIHGKLEHNEDDISEIQELVIATDSMPLEDWRRTRSFCWMTALLYFDKVLQIPMMLAHEIGGLSTRTLIEAFLDVEENDYPLIAEIRDFFEKTAHDIQGGGFEYVYSEKWLGIFWPADEYIFIKFAEEGKWPAFFAEAEKLIVRSLQNDDASLPAGILSDAIELNRQMINQPYLDEDQSLQLNFNILEFCEGVKTGQPVDLAHQPAAIFINRAEAAYDDFDAWCQEVVWWGNKKGAYLYNSRAVDYNEELAGHY
jgi:radical SAM superfamily enzyme YgiQ (UPF0313 family)